MLHYTKLTYLPLVTAYIISATLYYNLVVDEDVKKPTNQTNKQTILS